MTRRKRAWTPDTMGLPYENGVREMAGRQLKRLRTASELTPEWMARHLDISTDLYLSYEEGRVSIPFERAVRAGMLVGVPIEELNKDTPLPAEDRQLRSYIAVARKIQDLPADLRRPVVRLLETMHSMCGDD